SSAVADLRPQVYASIGASAIVTAGGDVKVDAESHRATAVVSTKGLTVGGFSLGTVSNDGRVTPTVRSWLGDNATVVATGRVDVIADILAATDTTGSALDDFFQPATDVNTTNDTIHFDAHGLGNGDSVTYSPNGNTAVTTDDSLGAGGPALESTYVDANGNTVLREYRVIVVDGDTIKLGSLFGAAAGDTGDLLNPAAGVDA